MNATDSNKVPFPNLAAILRDACKHSAGPFYDEAATEAGIAYAVKAVHSFAALEARNRELTDALAAFVHQADAQFNAGDRCATYNRQTIAAFRSLLSTPNR